LKDIFNALLHKAVFGTGQRVHRESHYEKEWLESMKPIDDEAKTGCCGIDSGRPVSSSSVLQMSVVCALIVGRTQLSAA